MDFKNQSLQIFTTHILNLNFYKKNNFYTVHLLFKATQTEQILIIVL